MFKHLGLALLVAIFLFLRIVNLEESVNFSAEQGLFLNEAYQIYKTKRITLIGPPSSVTSKISREFYHGPATYYLLFPPIIFGGEPMTASYYLILLNLLALLLLYHVVRKKIGRQVAFLTGLFFATFPQLVTFSRFVWNPNFLPLFSTVLLLLLLSVSRKKGFVYFSLVGICLGLCLQFHYQAALLILLTLVWLLIKKVSSPKFMAVILGFLIGFSPLIIFELRHNFYNLRTLLLIFRTGTDKTVSFLPFYYFLSLIPFISVLVGILISKLIFFNKLLGYFLILLYLAWAVPQIFSFSHQAPGMPEGWSYLGQKKAVEVIIQQDKKNYNIANLLSGDTRAQDMRYLLTIRNKLPMDVVSYPQAEWLFVLSRDNEEEILKNPVWEVSSFRPAEFANQWPIQNGISLFLFKKSGKLQVY